MRAWYSIDVAALLRSTSPFQGGIIIAWPFHLPYLSEPSMISVGAPLSVWNAAEGESHTPWMEVHVGMGVGQCPRIINSENYPS